MINRLTILVFVFCAGKCMAQKYDSIVNFPDSTRHRTIQCYRFNDIHLYYARPRPFSFVTQLPKTFSSSFKESFSRKSIPALTATILSTWVLIRFDESITKGTQQLSHHMGFESDIVYKNVVGFNMGSKYVPVYQAPRNINTALYSLGEGFTSMVISGGMFLYGKMKRDYRSLQTASQIVQAQLAVGVVTQAIKRISGRESPRVRTTSGGAWRPFASFHEFQKHTSRYDAFPSGHLASMMATITVLTSNYPEKRWLKPVAYATTFLVGYAMVNNGVHWSGDYPLALGIGYVCGKSTVKLNRFLNTTSKPRAR